MHRKRSPLSNHRKFVFASLTTVAFFVSIEGLLRLFVIAPPNSLPEDPFVGFEGSASVFEQTEVDGHRVAETRDSKRVWFNEQRFPVLKPPGTIRVACLGGSTTFGRPFGDRTSFAGWLRDLLPRVDPDHDWEVINVGGISYASYRVARVMEELSQYDVDVFILYTGQNEFLEQRTYGELMGGVSIGGLSNALVQQTRIGGWIRFGVESAGFLADGAPSGDTRYRMSEEVDEILNHSIGPASYQRDEAWTESVVTHFEHNLRRMRAIAEQAGAQWVIVSPISKLRDCAPFKSEFGAGHSEKELLRLEADLVAAEMLVRRGELESAVAALDAILERDTKNARVHFQRGQALFGLRRFEEARLAYLRAVDEDICPLRATSPIKLAIRRLADEQRVTHVDMERWLDAQLQRDFGHRCPGSESFLDHVHPAIEIHREIALETMRALRASGVDLNEPTEEQIEAANTAILDPIGTDEMGVAFRNLAKLWHWSGKFPEAVAAARDALRLIPEDLETRYVLADSLATLGETDAAIKEFDALFERGDYAPALSAFGELLFEEGQLTAAKGFLLQAVMVNEDEKQGQAYYVLGEVHASLSEHQMAVECFENAQRLAPRNEAVEEALRRARGAMKP